MANLSMAFVSARERVDNINNAERISQLEKKLEEHATKADEKLEGFKEETNQKISEMSQELSKVNEVVMALLNEKNEKK